jgi:glycosyltransferase 2 family protein
LTAKLRGLLLAALITLVFIGWIAYSSDWLEIWTILKDADFMLVVIAALLTLPVQWLRACRFKLMLNLTDQPLWPMFRVAGLLGVFNTLIPFRLGELSFPLMINKTFGTGKAYALGVLTFVRFFDLALVVLLLSVFGLLTLPAAELLKAFAITTAAGAVAGILSMMYLAQFVRSQVLRFTGEGSLSKLISQMADGAAALSSNHKLSFIGYSLLIWLLLGGMATISAMAVIPSLNVLQGYFAAAASNIAFALPVSGVASLGPAQVAWAEALRLNGQPYQLAIASALAVHVGILLGNALTALVVTIRRT